MNEYLHKVIFGITTLIPLANPLSTMALFLTLSRHWSPAEANRQILKTSINVVLIMVVTYYAGTWVMHGLGISIPGLRIAGGLTVSYIGFSMLFPSTREEQELPPSGQPSKTKDYSFFPLAMPSTIGPGTLAMVISIASTVHKDRFDTVSTHLAALTVAVAFGLLTWVGLRGAKPLMRALGASGLDAISRIMGFLLISMGVQFVINGALEIRSQTMPPAAHAVVADASSTAASAPSSRPDRRQD